MEQKQEIIEILKKFEKEFDINNLNHYQSLLLIIYNSLFIHKEELTYQLEYELFYLIQLIINKINEYYQSNDSIENIYNILINNKEE